VGDGGVELGNADLILGDITEEWHLDLRKSKCRSDMGKWDSLGRIALGNQSLIAKEAPNASCSPRCLSC
jgi:hypothetical protein